MKNPLEQFGEDDARFEMTPMIDMVFLLLVFFMCASRMSTMQNVPLEIPTATRAVVPRDRPDRFVVNITADGTIYGGNKVMSVDQLKDVVKQYREAMPDLKVYLRTDRDTPHKYVRKVMNVMGEIGIDDFIFGAFIPDGGK